MKQHLLKTLLITGFVLNAFSMSYADDLAEVNNHIKQGEYVQAAEKIENYVRQNPRSLEGRFLKGVILSEQGKTQDAIQVFYQLTQDFPTVPEPYNNLAVLYASTGQYNKARYALELAIKTHPAYSAAHDNLSNIYSYMASVAYNKALQLDKEKTNSIKPAKLILVREVSSQGGHTKRNGQVATTTMAPRLVTTLSPTTTPTPAAPPVKVAATVPKETPVVTKKPVTPMTPPPAAAPALNGEELKLSVPGKTNPAVGASTATTKNEPASAASNKDAIDTAKGWASAWAAKNVNGYLGYYGPNFNPPGNTSRKQWEGQRRDRISRPKSIQVRLENIKVTPIADGKVSVSFRQFYSSDHLHNTTAKTLVLERNKQNNKWQIQEERTGG